MVTTTQSKQLTKRDIKTLTLAALGGALEFYDFIIFVFFARTIAALFFPADLPDWLRILQTLAIFAAGYLIRPLGGIVMAHFGDRYGRKAVFSWSIALMALPTLAMGLLPSYAQIGIVAPILLLLLRILQGVAIGGEVPGAWVFVAEHVPNKQLAFACASLTSGLTLGILLGAGMASVLHSQLNLVQLQQYGFRCAFLFGGMLGLVALYLRRWLHETPVFRAMQQQRALASQWPLGLVWAHHRRAIWISILLTWCLSATIVVLILMAPVILQTAFSIPVVLSLNANIWATIMLFFGCLVAGLAADKFGVLVCLFFGSCLMFISYLIFFSLLAYFPSKMLFGYLLAGFFAGTIALVPVIMVNAFPAKLRFTGISTSYNLSYALFGGLTPIFVSILLTVSPFAIGGYLMALALVSASISYYLVKKPLTNLD